MAILLYRLSLKIKAGTIIMFRPFVLKQLYKKSLFFNYPCPGFLVALG